MEKTTKKKKTKRLKKRIGIIAVGGLSLVLTVCLSVGATLAWFAGSSWASKSLFMGGPVYVEMAGRGTSSGTDGSGDASWVGGDGSLDIKAAASRTSGTVTAEGESISDDVLLPGQKVQIYSQARVFSTAETNTVDSGKIDNESSGANTTNTSKSEDGYISYTDTSGRITTATTSVLRARFSISVEFDPSVGFNNFTNTSYMSNYPVQSTVYKGDGATDATNGDAWSAALGKTFTTTNNGTTVTYDGRRDGVANTDGKFTNTMTAGAETGYNAATDDLWQLQTRNKTSIYSWKYVSKTIYEDAAEAVPGTDGDAVEYVKMGAPFDGSDTTKNANGYYGVWIMDSTGKAIAESDAFYKARTNAYLESYVEYYVNEYGNTVTRSIKDSIDALDTQLNQYFVKLVNDSSDNIIAGRTAGFTVSDDGQMTAEAGGQAHNASWLYIDPIIGNDTNTNEISTSTGGWWYLVACDAGSVATTGDGSNKIDTVVDNVNASNVNEPQVTEAAFSRADRAATADGRLDAMLYEIAPDIDTGLAVGNNNGEAVNKVVSSAFPFVNGTFALPGDALTNVFANAKISFQISFQALQAFFPYTESIDKIDYKDPKLGTAKALSIRNAIPIYNEAFDYSEGLDSSDITGL